MALLLASVSVQRTCAQTHQPPQVLHIAAAADLQPVLPSLAARYTAQTGVPITPSFGSSATLTQQIQNGAPDDLFLSADCTHPQQLIAAKLAAGPEAIPYARGTLVLWARKDSPAQPLSFTALKSPRVARIAVANDLHAPYGQAAAAAIRALNLETALAGKLVVGENIAQTAQFALTGNAQAAFISLTLAGSRPFREAGSFISIPPVYPSIRQCGVVLLGGANPAAAAAFLHWLTTEATQRRLPPLGLEPAQ